MATVYLVNCTICERSFRSRKALLKHTTDRLPGQELPYDLTFNFDKQEVLSVPNKTPISNDEEYTRYLEWLGAVVEGLNSAHNPKVPARWYHRSMTNVPVNFFSHLLNEVTSASINSIRRAKHMKLPVWTERCLKISYKTFSLDDVKNALNEQKQVPLKIQRSYCGTEEIKDNRELFGREALEAAKNGILSSKKPSMKTELIINEGEGRQSRECEFIWWPIYKHSSNGNLTIRLFIGKVAI